MEALPPEMKLLILRLLVAADLASACQVNKDLFSLEADDQDCLWRRLFLAVCTRLQTGGCAGGVPHELEGDLPGHPQAPLARALQLATAEVRARVCYKSVLGCV